MLDLTAKHLLGDLSDAQIERTLPVGVANDDQQQDLALALREQIFAADSRVHVTEGGVGVWVADDSVTRSCTRTLTSLGALPCGQV